MTVCIYPQQLYGVEVLLPVSQFNNVQIKGKQHAHSHTTRKWWSWLLNLDLILKPTCTTMLAPIRVLGNCRVLDQPEGQSWLCICYLYDTEYTFASVSEKSYIPILQDCLGITTSIKYLIFVLAAVTIITRNTEIWNSVGVGYPIFSFIDVFHLHITWWRDMAKQWEFLCEGWHEEKLRPELGFLAQCNFHHPVLPLTYFTLNSLN